jgi:hypothetical protein
MPNQYLLCPFAVETLGTFGEEALQLVVSELGRRLEKEKLFMEASYS